MSEIKRFEPELVDFNDFAMTQYPNGDWVTYEDHQAKIDSLQAALVAVPAQEPLNRNAILLNSIAEAARCLGVAQVKEDKSAIEHWTKVVDDLVLSQQPAQEPEKQPTDLTKQLREYAADSGYSHNDYADTMLAAASEIERLESQLIEWNEFQKIRESQKRQLEKQMLGALQSQQLAQEPVAEKATVWFNALSRIATLLEMPEDQPIIQAVEVLESLLNKPAPEPVKQEIKAEFEAWYINENHGGETNVFELDSDGEYMSLRTWSAYDDYKKRQSSQPAQEPAKLKHHPICDGRYPSLCDACNAEAQEPALPKATIMPSTLKEPIQVPVSEPTALSVSWHVSKQPAPEPVKQESWMPIETAPKNTKIIVRYKNEYGNDRTVFAKYIEKFTEESSCDSENDEYDEATDTYYLKEGWLELIENWDEFSSVYFDSRNIITGWMPAPPVEAQP